MRIFHLSAIFTILLLASNTLAEKPIEDIIGMLAFNQFEEARLFVRTLYDNEPAMKIIYNYAQRTKDFFFMYETIRYRIQAIKNGVEPSSIEISALFSDMLFLYLLTLCNQSHRLPAASVLMTIFEHWYQKYLAPKFSSFPCEASQTTFTAVAEFLEGTFSKLSSNPFCTTILACVEQNYRFFDRPSCKTYDLYYMNTRATLVPKKDPLELSLIEYRENLTSLRTLIFPTISTLPFSPEFLLVADRQLRKKIPFND